MRSPVVRTSALWCTSATAGRNVVADLLAAARIIRVILTIAPRNHDRPALITILKRRVSANLFSRRYPDLCPPAGRWSNLASHFPDIADQGEVPGSPDGAEPVSRCPIRTGEP